MFGCVICMACVAAAAKGGDQLYSRQLLTFGRGAQEKIMAGRVLVFGADGVGAEVCKNLALAGVASITVAGDARAPRAAADLGAHFYAPRQQVAGGDGRAPPSSARGGSAASRLLEPLRSGDAAGTVVVATAGGERHDAAEGDALVLRSGARGVAAATLAVVNVESPSVLTAAVPPGASLDAGARYVAEVAPAARPVAQRPLAAVLAARAPAACVDGVPKGGRASPTSLVVFGAGATGCEILKNLALLGVRRVLVADDDAIEVSNLSRQFLYRPGDIGANKAAAAAARRRFNDDVDVVAPRPRGTRSFDARRRARPGRRPSAAFRERDGGTSLVRTSADAPSMRPSSSVATFGLGVPLRLDAGSRTASTRRPSARPGVDPAAALPPARARAAGDIFDDDFWAGVDLVFTALDSVEARLFVDGICVARTLPLVDCGTLGAAGSVQPAVPCAPGAAGRRRNPAPRSPWGAPPPARGATARGLGRRAPASPRHVTESYGATADPGAAGGAEDLVPVCTLKHHPYKAGRGARDARAHAAPTRARRDRSSGDTRRRRRTRAKVGLQRADELRCKQIAGKVVPAIATTTAVVSGLAVFEAAKILAGLGGDVARLRSTFVHLGAPLWGQAEPGPVNEWRLPGGGTATEWTVPAVRLAAADTVVDLVAKLEVDLFPGASVRSLVVRDESETLLYLRALHDGDEGARSWTVRERLRVLDAAPAAGHLDLLVTGDDGEGENSTSPP
ncbi:ubiquitin activating enzyme [Aureococcus anophagefferens]|nr:ubiquitin activating enzyme [Aureococcus anophagefferens]